MIVVRDTRASGRLLQGALARGLSAAGVRVRDGGVLPTPAVAVLVPREGCMAGAVISASHNPAAYNGIKFFGSAGGKLSDRQETAIEELLESPAVPGSLKGSPARPAPEAKRDYLAFLRSTWPRGLALTGFPLVVDCAHGATGAVAEELFASLGCAVTVLHNAPDGRNINLRCGALHPGGLARRVRRAGARLGVAFDGDGDRAIFVDETGAVKDGDAVLLACARRMKEEGRLAGDTVVVTVMSNLGLVRALESLGIKTVETAVGDRHVALGMERSGAALGGEPSGHVIFRDLLPSGDGLLTTLQVLAVMARTGRPLSALTSLAVRYPQTLLNVPVRERAPLETLGGFNRVLEKIRADLGRSGRVVVRYSGTEPLLRIMVEGPVHALIARRARDLAAALPAGLRV
jgi:phosphoglucosamine mutase